MPVFIRPGPVGIWDDEIDPWRYPKRDDGINLGRTRFPSGLNGAPGILAGEEGSLFYKSSLSGDRNTLKWSDSTSVAYVDNTRPAGSEDKPALSMIDDTNERICPNMTNKEFIEEFNVIRDKLISILSFQTIPALNRWDKNDKVKAKKWFGTDSNEFRMKLQEGYKKCITVLRKLEGKNFIKYKPGEGLPGCAPYSGPEIEDVAAAVCQSDDGHHIQIHQKYCESNMYSYQSRSKLAIIFHEITHFNDVFSSLDYGYNQINSQRLAGNNSMLAQQNADSFVFFALDGVTYAK